MTTYASAVFDKCILNAFTVAGATAAILWKAAQTSRVYCILTTVSEVANKATFGTYADIASQVANGSGYTTGGTAMTLTDAALSGAAPNVCQFGAAATSWTSSSFTALTAITQWALVAEARTTAGNLYMSFHDLSNGTGTGQTVTNGTLTLTWAATGVFTITISAAA